MILNGSRFGFYCSSCGFVIRVPRMVLEFWWKRNADYIFPNVGLYFT